MYIDHLNDTELARRLELQPETFDADSLRALAERFHALTDQDNDSERYADALDELGLLDHIEAGGDVPDWVTLDDFLNSGQWQDHQESLFSDMAINDPERFDRIQAAAENGADRSTHREVIEDQRSGVQFLAESIVLLPYNRHALESELDHIEAWHKLNGTLDQEVG